jgi:DNA-directed RNA polymerase specialized sigma24 family protein
MQQNNSSGGEKFPCWNSRLHFRVLPLRVEPNASNAGGFMSIADRVNADLPFLRRFARSLTGSQAVGDAAVVTTLEAIIADPSLLEEGLSPRVALYRAFLRSVNAPSPAAIGAGNRSAINGRGPVGAGGGGSVVTAAVRAADRNLATLPPRARQAFLLAAVEEFRPADAARIMDVSEAELQALIEEAGRDIARQVATDVVIIEDEPLIALDLVQLVNELGHRVVRVARTAEQAVEATRSLRPGLVLADIHLADGSSGLDAVNEILRTLPLPVVFITAFPQRLLTGTRPEPTVLVTKPFQPQNVKAVISQALFFDIRGRPDAVARTQP